MSRIKYRQVVRDAQGDATAGALVTVRDDAGSLATIYDAASGGSTLGNGTTFVTGDGDPEKVGAFEFWIEAVDQGDFSITVGSGPSADTFPAVIGANIALPSDLSFQGGWDASGGAFPTSTTAGEYWDAETAGTIDSVSFAIGDQVIALIDGASTTTYAANWYKKAGGVVTQADLDLKAPLASPALTGTPTAPTAAASTNTTQLATTAFVQAELSGYASEAYIDGRLDVTETIGRGVTPVSGGGAANAGTYAFADPVDYDGTITRLRAYASTGVTIKFRRFTLLSGEMTQVGSDTDVALSAGANDIEVSISVSAGDQIGFYTPASGVNFDSATSDSGGYYYSAGDVTTYTDGSAPRTTTQLQIGFDVEQPRITLARLDEIETDVDANFATSRDVSDGLGDIADAVSTDVESYPATTQFGGTAFGEYAAALLLDGVATGTVIRDLTIYRQYVAGTATKVRLEVYQRPDGETETIPENCTQLFEQDYTLAELGLSAGGTDRPDVTFTFPTPFIKAAGKHLAWMVQALDGSDTPVSQSFGYMVDAGASQPERGWYRANASSPTFTALSSPNRFASSVLRTGYSQSKGFLALSDAETTIDGTDVVVSGSVTTRGTKSAFSGTLSPSLAAAGKERMDLIQLDRLTLGLSLVAGDERDEQLDSLEHQNAATANNLIVGRARVTDAAVQAVPVADFRGLVRIGTEGEMAYHVQRNRDILRALLSKAQRAQAINLGGYGDSITAIQSGTPAYTANGTVRDRGHSYLSNYPADSLALVPLYDFSDGAGTVHTKLGWNWSIKAALDAIAGSEVVTYLNYGIGGTTSQSTTDNGLFATRIAEPVGDSLDAVVIAFGMNERGQTYTYANIVNMVGQFQAVGTACVVMGCPRPNANQSLSAWRYTNDALEAAAMDTGAAYVSTAAIADDTTLGGIGVPAEALASANTTTGGNNHPGIWELDKYGEAAVLQLGL